MKPVRSILGLAGLVLIVVLLAGSCTPWNPLAGAGLGDLKIYWVGDSVIYSSDLDGGSISEVYRDVSMPSYSAIAVDPINGHVYWSDTMMSVVYRADLDGANKQTVASVSAAALAVDPYAEKIYFLVGMTEIARMNLDGSGYENLLTAGGNISDIELDLVNGKIYWCDGMQIRSSALSKPLSSQTVFDTGAATIERIAVDIVGGMIYYSESGAPTNLRKVGVSGGTSSFIYATGVCGGLDIDPFAGRLYWSRPSASTGIYIDSIGTDGTGFQPVVSTSYNQAARLALYLWP